MNRSLLLAAIAIAALVFLLLGRLDDNDHPDQVNTIQNSEVSYQMQQLERRTYDNQGLLVETLVSEAAFYYQNEERLNLISPHWQQQNQTTNWSLVSLSADVQNNIITAQQQVLLADDNKDPLQLSTDLLYLELPTNYAYTDQAVQLQQGALWRSNGIGFEADLNKEEMAIHDQVKSTYYPQP